MDTLQQFLGFDDASFQFLLDLAARTTVDAHDSATDGAASAATSPVQTEDTNSNHSNDTAPAEHDDGDIDVDTDANALNGMDASMQLARVLAALLAHPDAAVLRHNAISHLADKQFLRIVPKTCVSIDGGRPLPSSPCQTVELRVLDGDVATIQTRLALGEALLGQAISEVRLRPPRTRSGGAHEKGAAANSAEEDAIASQKHGSYPADVDYASIPPAEDLAALVDADPDFKADVQQFIQDLSLPSSILLDPKQICARIYRMLVARDRRALLTQMRTEELLGAAALVESVVVMASCVNKLAVETLSRYKEELAADTNAESRSADSASTPQQRHTSLFTSALLRARTGEQLSCLAAGLASQKQLLPQDHSDDFFSFGIRNGPRSMHVEYVPLSFSVAASAVTPTDIQRALYCTPGSVRLGTMPEHAAADFADTELASSSVDTGESAGINERAILALTHDSHYVHTRRRPGEVLGIAEAVDDDLPMGMTLPAALATVEGRATAADPTLQQSVADEPTILKFFEAEPPQQLIDLILAVDPVIIRDDVACMRIEQVNTQNLQECLGGIRPQDCLLAIELLDGSVSSGFLWGAHNDDPVNRVAIRGDGEPPSWKPVTWELPANCTHSMRLKFHCARPKPLLAVEGALTGRSAEDLLQLAAETGRTPTPRRSATSGVWNLISGNQVTMPGATFFVGAEEGSLNDIGTWDRYNDLYLGYIPSGYTKIDASLRILSKRPKISSIPAEDFLLTNGRPKEWEAAAANGHPHAYNDVAEEGNELQEKPRLIIPSAAEDDFRRDEPSSNLVKPSPSSEPGLLPATMLKKVSPSSSTLFLSWSQPIAQHTGSTRHVSDGMCNEIHAMPPVLSPLPDVSVRDILIAAMRAEHRLARLHSAAIAASNPSTPKPSPTHAESTEETKGEPSDDLVKHDASGTTFCHPSLEALLAKRRRNRAPAQPTPMQNTKVTLKQLTSQALRRLCDVSGLPSSGDKTALIIRLYSYLIADESELPQAGSGSQLSSLAERLDADGAEKLAATAVEGDLLAKVVAASLSANTNPVVILPPAAYYELPMLRSYYAHHDVLAILEDLYPFYLPYNADLESSDHGESPAVSDEINGAVSISTMGAITYFEVEGRSRGGRMRKPTSRIVSLGTVGLKPATRKPSFSVDNVVSGTKRKQSMDVSTTPPRAEKKPRTAPGGGEPTEAFDDYGVGAADMDIKDDLPPLDFHIGDGALQPDRKRGMARSRSAPVGVDAWSGRPPRNGTSSKRKFGLRLDDDAASKPCYSPAIIRMPCLLSSDTVYDPTADVYTSPAMLKLVALLSPFLISSKVTRDGNCQPFIISGHVPDARCTVTRAVADVTLAAPTPGHFEIAAGYVAITGDTTRHSEHSQHVQFEEDTESRISERMSQIYSSIAGLLNRFPIQQLSAATGMQLESHRLRASAALKPTTPNASPLAQGLLRSVTFEATTITSMSAEDAGTVIGAVLPVLCTETADENFAVVKSTMVRNPICAGMGTARHTITEGITAADVHQAVCTQPLLSRYVRSTRPFIFNWDARRSRAFKAMGAFDILCATCRDVTNRSKISTPRPTFESKTAYDKEMEVTNSFIYERANAVGLASWRLLNEFSHREAIRRRTAALLMECSARGLRHIAGYLVASARASGGVYDGQEELSAPVSTARFKSGASEMLQTAIRMFFGGALPESDVVQALLTAARSGVRCSSVDPDSQVRLLTASPTGTDPVTQLLLRLRSYLQEGELRTVLGQRLVHPAAVLQYIVTASAVDCFFTGTMDLSMQLSGPTAVQ